MIRYAVVSDSFCFTTDKCSGLISKDDIINEYLKVFDQETLVAEFVSMRSAQNFLRTFNVSSVKVPRSFKFKGSRISCVIAYIEILDYIDDIHFEVIDCCDFKAADIVL